MTTCQAGPKRVSGPMATHDIVWSRGANPTRSTPPPETAPGHLGSPTGKENPDTTSQQGNNAAGLTQTHSEPSPYTLPPIKYALSIRQRKSPAGGHLPGFNSNSRRRLDQKRHQPDHRQGFVHPMPNVRRYTNPRYLRKCRKGPSFMSARNLNLTTPRWLGDPETALVAIQVVFNGQMQGQWGKALCPIHQGRKRNLGLRVKEGRIYGNCWSRGCKDSMGPAAFYAPPEQITGVRCSPRPHETLNHPTPRRSQRQRLNETNSGIVAPLRKTEQVSLLITKTAQQQTSTLKRKQHPQ